MMCVINEITHHCSSVVWPALPGAKNKSLSAWSIDQNSICPNNSLFFRGVSLQKDSGVRSNSWQIFAVRTSQAVQLRRYSGLPEPPVTMQWDCRKAWSVLWRQESWPPSSLFPQEWRTQPRCGVGHRTSHSRDPPEDKKDSAAMGLPLGTVPE